MINSRYLLSPTYQETEKISAVRRSNVGPIAYHENHHRTPSYRLITHKNLRVDSRIPSLFRLHPSLFALDTFPSSIRVLYALQYTKIKRYQLDESQNPREFLSIPLPHILTSYRSPTTFTPNMSLSQHLREEPLLLLYSRAVSQWLCVLT